MRTTKRNATPASAFMASFTAAGRLDPAGPKLCVQCQRNRARWDSIYCSEHCHKQFLDALKEKS